jgi:HK97 family phage portal protein
MASFKANIKALLSDGIKSASGLFSGGQVGSGDSRGSFWGNGTSSPGLFTYRPGSAINWDLVTGGISDNPIAATCLNIICDNYVQARIRIERKQDGEDKYEPDPSHPLLPILKKPNPFYSWAYLTKGILTSMHGQGDAYIGIERNGDGTPSELYWLPYGVKPYRAKGSKRLIDGWLYKSGDKNSKEVQVPLEDIIHIPMGADPARPGMGLSGWQALKQDQYILQQGGNFTANVMRNNGTAGAIITPKSVKNADGIELQPEVDPQQVTDTYRSMTSGDKVGGAMFFGFPADIMFPKNSPQDLALDTILDRPEANICAVFRVSILLVGAHGGRHAKTYANMTEARQSLWEECLLPLEQIIAAELTTQLLPQMGGDAETERVAYDTSGIRALQPDLDKLHDRVRKDWAENGIDLHTFMVETKRVAEDWMIGIYRWMLPSISDRATSTDSLMPPSGMAEERSIPAAGTNGTGKPPAPVSLTHPLLARGAFPAMAGKSANGAVHPDTADI